MSVAFSLIFTELGQESRLQAQLPHSSGCLLPKAASRSHGSRSPGPNTLAQVPTCFLLQHFPTVLSWPFVSQANTALEKAPVYSYGQA